MYYIPKGKPMHEKLSTTFVRMEGLLEELKSENFDGYVMLNFPRTSGFLFIENGQIVNAAELNDKERRAGIAVQEQLLQLSQTTKGTLSVYYLPKAIIQTLAGIANGETVYENLTTDWANLGRLLRKLAAERRTYYISLAFDQGTSKRGLIFVNGDSQEAVCSVGDEQLTGKEALDKLTHDCETEVATFSLYRQAGTPAMTSIDDRDVAGSINRLASQTSYTPPAQPATPVMASPAPAYAPTVAPPPVAPPVAPMTPMASSPAPAAATPYYEALLPSGAPSESRIAELNLGESRPKPPVFEDILEVVEAEAPAKASPAAVSLSGAQVTPAPLPEPQRTGGEMRDLMILMSRVVAAVEKGMTAAGRGSSFPTALRAGLLAVTERYPFLDPFAAEFEYQDREIVFVGTAQPNEFAIGLSEALRQMVEDLIYSSNGRVRDYIAEELRKVERENVNEIKEFNLGNLTEKICQH